MREIPAYLNPEIIESFWRNVRRAGPDSCWLWFAGTGSHGYGEFCTPKMVLAHRFAWQVANGREVPGRLHVLHECDIKCCVNPAHLKCGTQRQNLLDALNRNRMPTVLNANIVLRIRRLHYEGGMTRAAIADALEVPYSTIAHAISGECWRHVRGAA